MKELKDRKLVTFYDPWSEIFWSKSFGTFLITGIIHQIIRVFFKLFFYFFNYYFTFFSLHFFHFWFFNILSFLYISLIFLLCLRDKEMISPCCGDNRVSTKDEFSWQSACLGKDFYLMAVFCWCSSVGSSFCSFQSCHASGQSTFHVQVMFNIVGM